MPTRERLSIYSGGKRRRTFEERKSALQQKEKKNAQAKEITPFLTQYHPVVPNLEQPCSQRSLILDHDEWVAFNIESAFSERDIQRASRYLVQKS